MDGEGRGFMHYHDEGGHGSGGWEEGDDGDSSGPGRLHASTVKRAGGTGMTEEELAALDPKRVRRIIANRQVSSPVLSGETGSGLCGTWEPRCMSGSRLRGHPLLGLSA